jgi:hypothetical protein
MPFLRRRYSAAMAHLNGHNLGLFRPRHFSVVLLALVGCGDDPGAPSEKDVLYALQNRSGSDIASCALKSHGPAVRALPREKTVRYDVPYEGTCTVTSKYLPADTYAVSGTFRFYASGGGSLFTTWVWKVD